MRTESTNKAKYIRRYTDISATIDLLMNRRLTLLSPITWDDRNDRSAMMEYSNSQGYQTVLGVCLSLARETYHHWKVFTQGSSGICIEFKRPEFINSIPGGNFRQGIVAYKSSKEFLSQRILKKDLPFIKGDAYRHEIEYRIVYSSKSENLAYQHIPIDLSVIRTIKLSPWMPKPLVESTQKLLNSIEDCSGIPIKHSKIVQNDAWIEYINGKV